MKKIGVLGMAVSLIASSLLLIRFMQIAPTAFGNAIYPKCEWLQGSCDPGIVYAGNALLIGALACVAIAVVFASMMISRR